MNQSNKQRYFETTFGIVCKPQHLQRICGKPWLNSEGDLGEENEHRRSLTLMLKDRMPVHLIRRAGLQLIKDSRRKEVATS